MLQFKAFYILLTNNIEIKM